MGLFALIYRLPDLSPNLENQNLFCGRLGDTVSGWGQGQRHTVADKVTCGHCSVPFAAAADLALGMVEGGHTHC